MSHGTFHVEALAQGLAAVLHQVGPVVSAAGFYLAGGTALAVHLGHRRSVDLDWFHPDEPRDPDVFAARLRTAGLDVHVDQTAPGTLHGSLRGTRVTFLQYDYPLLRPTVPWDAFSVQLASVEDIACMKLVAVAQRGARKDFLDVHAIGTRAFGLPAMMRLFQDKYAHREVGHVLIGLSYFEDAEREPTPELLEDIDWPTVKADIRAWVRSFVDSAR